MSESQTPGQPDRQGLAWWQVAGLGLAFVLIAAGGLVAEGFHAGIGAVLIVLGVLLAWVVYREP